MQYTVTTVGVLMSGIESRMVAIGIPIVAASLGADARPCSAAGRVEIEGKEPGEHMLESE